MQIDRQEVARYLGLRRGRTLDPAWAERLEETVLEAEMLVEPAFAWRTYPVKTILPGEIILSGSDLTVTGLRMVRRLAPTEYITAMAVTCGPALEEAAAEAFARGEYVRGTILDAAGSAAAEGLAEEVNAQVAAEARAQGYNLKPRVSPGYGDWELSVQPRLLKAAGAENLGIRLSEALLLIPRKSVTAVIAWTKEYSAAAGCEECTQANCRFPKEEKA